MNILTDERTPTSFGEFVDSLIITNIRMWHEQERIYELDSLERMSLEEMLAFLKKATLLNLMRNRFMDGLDAHLQAKMQALGLIPVHEQNNATGETTQADRIWEPT